jgi:hypothetical protein
MYMYEIRNKYALVVPLFFDSQFNGTTWLKNVDVNVMQLAEQAAMLPFSEKCNAAKGDNGYPKPVQWVFTLSKWGWVHFSPTSLFMGRNPNMSGSQDGPALPLPHTH